MTVLWYNSSYCGNRVNNVFGNMCKTDIWLMPALFLSLSVCLFLSVYDSNVWCVFHIYLSNIT